MEKIAFENINEKLVDEFPVLRTEYQSEVRLWSGEQPGPHVIYGDILNPYILSLLQSRNQDSELNRVFDFLESLAASGNPLVEEVVAVTVCERLIDEGKAAVAKKYMGPITRRFCEDIERAWGLSS